MLVLIRGIFYIDLQIISAVDQAVLLNDQSVLVDLLTVVTLRPSIWNLDLCTSLLPSLEKLLQSKYEM